MAGVSETAQRKEYLVCLRVTWSLPSLSCGSTVEVVLRAGLEAAGPEGQGLMEAAKDGPGITDIGPEF